jgi:hypothetical protein
VLLDAAFLIDSTNGADGAVERAREPESELVQQRLSSVTLFELYYGAARSNQCEVERETIESVLASKPVYPADSAVMRKAGWLSGELMNVDDFERLGVDVETC